MHQQNQIPNRIAYEEVLRQLKEATGALDQDVSKIFPITLRRDWVICMTRFAATMTNRIWASQEDGEKDTSYYFTLEKFPDVPIFNLGKELKIQVDLLPTDTPVEWTACVWQPSK